MYKEGTRMDKKITIAIATESQDKIEGIIEGFSEIFPDYEIVVYKSKTESGVPDQPFGKDTYIGAKNRIDKIKAKFDEELRKKGIDINYYISCEAGIDDTIEEKYFSEQVVCLYNSESSKYFWGRSSSWDIPSEDIEYIRKNGLDRYLRDQGCTGLMDIMDGKYISRKDAVLEGVLAALASERIQEKRKEKSKQILSKGE